MVKECFAFILGGGNKRVDGRNLGRVICFYWIDFGCKFVL